MESDKQQLSAYERWELPALEQNEPGAPDQSVWQLPKEEVEEVQWPTADELEAIRKAAYREGFDQGKQEGHAKGHEQGLSKGQQEIQAAVARLGQVMHALMQPIAEQDNALETVLVELVETTCTVVLRRELHLDSSQILRIVREAIGCVYAGSKRLTVHVHPVDAEIIRQYMTSLPDFEQWRITEHNALTPGGCVVEADDTLVDATVDKRLEQLVRQIYEKEFCELPGQEETVGDWNEMFGSTALKEMTDLELQPALGPEATVVPEVNVAPEVNVVPEGNALSAESSPQRNEADSAADTPGGAASDPTEGEGSGSTS